MKKLSQPTLEAVVWLTILTLLLPIGAQVKLPAWWFLLGMAWGVSLSYLIVSIRLHIR